MANDKRDVVQVLERELNLLQSGWYDPFPTMSWRAPLIFEDSPTCLNFADKMRSGPCRECVLMQFVPVHYLGEKVPCRHIPLNEAGETVDTLYRCGTVEESKAVMRNWLISTIKRTKEKRARFRPDREHPGPVFHVSEPD
jgi:hypothetical protein